MLHGVLQVYVQGADRQYRVVYVHPDNPRQKEEKLPIKLAQPELQITQTLVTFAESFTPTASGWQRVAEVEFDEQESRFVKFRLVGDAAVEAAALVQADATVEVEYITLQTAPETPRLNANHLPPVNPAPAPVSQAVGEARFRNPYNFVPTPPRRFAAHPDHPLSDGKPVSWDRLHPDLYSGTLDVEMRTTAPMLASDPAYVTLDNQHKTFARVTIDEAGKPRIDATSLRGVLSSAYETITHSRWRVFHKRDQRLAKRMPANDALGTVPFIIKADASGDLFAHLLTGYAGQLPTWDQRWNASEGMMLAAFLPNYGPVAGTAPTASPAHHGRQVWARIGWVTKEIRKNDGRIVASFDHWMVLDWADDEPALRSVNDTWQPPNRTAVPEEIHNVRGWLCVTNQNMGNKKYERLFFNETAKQFRVPLGHIGSLNTLGKSWKEVVAAYRDAHDDAEIWDRKGASDHPERYLGQAPGKTAWSGHLYRDGSARARNLVGIPSDPDYATLQDGTLGYVYLDHDQQALALVPVHIARVPFSHSPLDQLHPSLRPATTREQLSAADRVFGWVSQAGPGSHRGQLRLFDIHCDTDAAQAIERHNPPVPLAILSTPKPKQTRFYTAHDVNGTPRTGAKVNDDFAAQASLRGPKVYPHQANLPEGYWNVPGNRQPAPGGNGRCREYLKGGAGAVQKTSQNQSVAQWIAKGTTFTFKIQVTNLNAAELGALLWLLSLSDRSANFRGGGGKPLGFGSFTLKLNAHDLATGTAHATQWKSFGGQPIEIESNLVQELISSYQASLLAPFRPAISEFERLPMIAGWLRAASGADDTQPTHYPRLEPTTPNDAKNYEWFQRHENLPLPSILDDDTLPY